jgi:hypothetical protein
MWVSISPSTARVAGNFYFFSGSGFYYQTTEALCAQRLGGVSVRSEILKTIPVHSLTNHERTGMGYASTAIPFSRAISVNAPARCAACFPVIPYVLNFQTFVAPGITPVIPFSSSAEEK